MRLLGTILLTAVVDSCASPPKHPEPPSEASEPPAASPCTPPDATIDVVVGRSKTLADCRKGCREDARLLRPDALSYFRRRLGSN